MLLPDASFLKAVNLTKKRKKKRKKLLFTAAVSGAAAEISDQNLRTYTRTVCLAAELLVSTLELDPFNLTTFEKSKGGA